MTSAHESVELRVVPVTSPQFPIVADLARRIWPECFRGIISGEQCEYMLHQRYAPEALASALVRGMTYELLEVPAMGFVGFGAHGPTEKTGEWKLWQAYVLPEWRGRGLGRCYIDHVASVAWRSGRHALMLTVNKGNLRAQALYQRSGFKVCESARFDIGNGFVMDDLVMVKHLVPS